MYRIVILAALLAGASASAVAQQPVNTTPASPRARAEAQPLLFYVARGEANACGLGCSEWIAVEGLFNANSATRFREFLTRLNRRTLPVFFHSPGGMQSEAYAIGRMLREFGMMASVARTMPEACQPGPNAGACGTAKRSGETLPAQWTSIGATCSSACVYALIGARDRWVPTGARLGIHATYTECSAPAGTPAEVREERCANSRATNRARLDSYVKQMGVDPKLVESAFRTPHAEIRYLSRAEISSFGIARRRFEESPWQYMDRTIVNFVNQPGEANGVMRRIGMIQYGCSFAGSLFVSYYRPTNQDDTGTGIVLAAVVGDQRYPLATWAVSRFDSIEPGAYFDRRSIWLAGRHIDLSKLTIEIKNSAEAQDAPTIVIHPPVNGLDRAWDTLKKSCGI
jgi:hypothetical protein